MECISHTIEETGIYAASVLQSLSGKEKEQATVVALSGDLGSGKTSFTKELGALLGISKNEITSPTFVIQKMYAVSHSQFTHFIHIDAYRLESARELLVLGFEDILRDPNNLICIEWPERVAGCIPDNAITIECAFIDETTRRYTLRDGKTQ